MSSTTPGARGLKRKARAIASFMASMDLGNHSARLLRQWKLARRACAGGPASETASIRRAEPSPSTEVVFKHGHRPNDGRTMQCGGSPAAYGSRVSQQDAS